MKKSTIFADLVLLMGILLLCAAVGLCFWARNQAPKVMETLDTASAQTKFLMEDLCSGNYAAARERMYRQPDLGLDQPPQSQTGALIWEAFEKNMSYEFISDCYTSDSGLCRDVRITTLDISRITSDMKQRVKRVLEDRISQAESVDDIYEGKNDYREAFVMDVLHEAARQAVENNRETVTRDVTIQMVCQDGQWWIVPDEVLLEVISGVYSDTRRVEQ